MKGRKSNQVAILINSLEFGGAEKQALFVARTLKKNGFDVAIVVLIDSSSERDTEGLDIRRVGWSRSQGRISIFLRAYRILKEFHPGLIISFNFPSNLVGRLVAGLLPGTRLITSIRNENLGARWRHRAIRLFESACDVCVTNSERVGETLRENGTLSRWARRVTIMNYVEVDVVPDIDRSGEDSILSRGGERTLTYLAPGSLKAKKNFVGLIRAWKEVVRCVDARLLIAGEGPLREELSRLIVDLGLSESVSLLGLRSDLPDVMNAADVVVLSSLWEGLPNVVQEAMALGKPVVATDVGGTSELLEDGKSGYLVPAGDEESLARHLIRVGELSDDERAAMGRAGLERIRLLCDPERIGRQWVELVRELLA